MIIGKYKKKLITTNDIKTLISSDEPGTLEQKKCPERTQKSPLASGQFFVLMVKYKVLCWEVIA